MGLLRFSQFSSIPNLFKKIQSRRQQKERYSPTWLEWAAVNQQQVIESANHTSGGTILFTVPRGEVLFITSVKLSIEVEGGVGTSNGSIEIAGEESFIRLRVSSGAPTAFSESMNFTMPFRVNAGKQIQINSANAGSITHVLDGGFIGFLVPDSFEFV